MIFFIEIGQVIMALVSSFFKGNAALEACALKDSAHITLGAIGDHVAKIQFALFALDRLKIDQEELVSQRYGKSTASAVLAYKKNRKIINHYYHEPFSIFFDHGTEKPGGVDRTFLKPEHALTLSKMSSKL
jgi:hypothetical protein